MRKWKTYMYFLLKKLRKCHETMRKQYACFESFPFHQQFIFNFRRFWWNVSQITSGVNVRPFTTRCFFYRIIYLSVNRNTTGVTNGTEAFPGHIPIFSSFRATKSLVFYVVFPIPFHQQFIFNFRRFWWNVSQITSGVNVHK
jgi:hypothetical protein